MPYDKPRNMVKANYTVFCLVLAAILLITLSCNRKQASPSTASLASIETLFGIQFPTNSSDRRVTSWTYTTRLDGPSSTRETIARFALAEGEFQKWRSVLTNRLAEIEDFEAGYDPRLVEKANWWDPHKWPASNVTLFVKDAPAISASQAKIYVFAARGATNCIVYVHSRQVTWSQSLKARTVLQTQVA